MKKRWSTRTLGMVLACALLAAACGSSDDEVATAEAEFNSSTAPTTTAEPATTAAPETTTAPTTTNAPATTVADELVLDGERVYDPLPTTEDPCAKRLDVGEHRFSVLVDDDGHVSEVPLVINVDELAAGVDVPALAVGFHGEGSFDFRAWGDPGVPSRNLDGALVVEPIADTSGSPFWSQTATFNLAVVETLWDTMESSLCFDLDRVVWSGLAQGALLVATAICDTDVPMAYAEFSLGMTFQRGCDPARTVPLFTTDVFDFDPFIGRHWDGPWTSPVLIEVEAYSVDATPADLDRWAEIYGCTDERREETIPDTAGVLERESVVFSYTDCDSPLTAFGFQGVEFGEQPVGFFSLEGRSDITSERLAEANGS